MIRFEHNIIDPTKQPFYLIQIPLWIIYGIIYRSIWIFYGKYTPPDLKWIIIYVTGGFICSTLAAHLYWRIRNKSFILQFFVASVMSALLGVTWRFTANFMDYQVFGDVPISQLNVFKNLIGGMASTIQLVAWSAAFLLIAYYKKYKDEETRAIKAELQAKEALVKQLHQQISPHFLFNVLNSVDTLLMKEDIGQARSMVEKLSSYLRHSLKEAKQYHCTLFQEIENARRYLEIEKVRFGDKLEVQWDCTPDVNDFPVPRLVLQPLIENAIKHSISKSVHGGVITISTFFEDETIRISVTNRRHHSEQETTPTEKQDGFGIGLTNTKARLNVFYDESANLIVNESAAGEFSVIIEIDTSNIGEDLV